MQIITLPTEDQWYNLYTLTGIPSGTSIVVTSKASKVVFLARQPSQPTEDSFPLQGLETIIVNGSSDAVWVKGAIGPLIVQESPASITPFAGATLPADLYTSEEQGFRRIRVDTAQTSFFEGREFRSFFEFNIPAGNVRIFKFTSAVDFILFEQSLVVDSGDVRFQAILNPTEVATFNTAVPTFGKNRMDSRPQPYYTSQVTINTTATTVALNSGVTGGTVAETIRVVASNATAQQQTVSAGAQSERGLPAGTYYLRLHNFGNGAATGVYNLFWEERP